MCQKLTNILGEWAVLLRHPNRVHVLDTEQIRRGQAQLDARREEDVLHSQQTKPKNYPFQDGVKSVEIMEMDKTADDYLEYTSEPWFGGAMSEAPRMGYQAGSL